MTRSSLDRGMIASCGRCLPVSTCGWRVAVRVTCACPPTAASTPRLRMIIQSLLDTDLYKFTMMQVVLHHFPGAQVEYRFRCRTEGVNLRPHLDAIRAE